jgi:glycosyltransferase involved in cell wall biosynthesis
MKVVHLTSAHEATDDRILLKECAVLAAGGGYAVTLVAPGATPTVINGVRILGVPHRPTRLGRMTRTVVDVLRIALASGAEICHFHDPELIPVALVLKLSGRKVVFDVHENDPASIMDKRWIWPFLRRPIARLVDELERRSCWFVDHFVIANPAQANRFPIAASTVVQNFVMLQERELFSPTGRPHRERPLNVVYLGGITLSRGIREMVQSVALLADDRSRLVLAGSFSDTDLQRACEGESGWRRVEFLGWRARAELPALLASARAGLVVLHPTLNYLGIEPIKLFEYMAAGLPVIASDFPLWRTLIERERCGLLVDPLSPDAIAGAIHWVFEHPEEAESMGRRGRRAVLERYNWESESKKLLALYARLAT